MLIDTHTHLNAKEYFDDLDLVIKRANEVNVMKFLVVGYDHETNNWAQELKIKFHGIYPTAGIHPSNIDEIDELNLIENLALSKKIYAIGECGLDFYWHKENKELQIQIFKKQIELSIKYQLPLIIHMREATNEMLKVLRNYQNQVKGVMHGYSGSLEDMHKFIDIGMHIALGGPVTFKNAVLPKVIAKHVPLDKLLLETDCPYLTPQKYRGTRNEPMYLSLICEEIAMIKDLEYEEVALKTSNNAIKLFNLEG